MSLLAGLRRLSRLELACVSDVRGRLALPGELRALAGSLTHLDLGANMVAACPRALDVLGEWVPVRRAEGGRAWRGGSTRWLCSAVYCSALLCSGVLLRHGPAVPRQKGAVGRSVPLLLGTSRCVV